jgi:hypothetical protein
MIVGQEPCSPNVPAKTISESGWNSRCNAAPSSHDEIAAASELQLIGVVLSAQGF